MSSYSKRIIVNSQNFNLIQFTNPQIEFLQIIFLRIRQIERIGLDSEHPYQKRTCIEKFVTSSAYLILQKI